MVARAGWWVAMRALVRWCGRWRHRRSGSDGFWVVWHLEGGFEGLRATGMSRASIYRRVKLFRIAFGMHPDEFVMPGVTLDLEEYQARAILTKYPLVRDRGLSVRPPVIVHDMGLRASWGFTLYPEAGEGGGCFRPPIRRSRSGVVCRRGAGAGGGRSAGADEAAPLLRREPAEPVRDADLCRGGLPRPAGSCARMWRGSSGGFGRSWAGSRCRMRGRRSGIPAGTVCMSISRSAATSSTADP